MQTATHAPLIMVRCPSCSMALAAETFVEGGVTDCPNCRSRLTATFFPALGQAQQTVGVIGERVLEGEAACYFHAERRAVVACDRCGRFMCPLCDVVLGSRHICPACLAAGIGTERVSELISKRWRWDNLALVSGLVPVLGALVLWPLFAITGPAAIFAAIFGWRRPGSLVYGTRRWVAILGLLLGVAQCVGLAGMTLLIWRKGFDF